MGVRPSNHRPPDICGKKVLLIDSCEATREVRAAVLRNHGIEVLTAENFSAARFLWRPKLYDLVLLDVRRYLPGESLAFRDEIKEANPPQDVVFLVGPPVYLSRTWPEQVASQVFSQGQWAETVKRLTKAA